MLRLRLARCYGRKLGARRQFHGTTAGGADSFAFGDLEPTIGDAGDGINFEQLASGALKTKRLLY